MSKCDCRQRKNGSTSISTLLRRQNMSPAAAIVRILTNSATQFVMNEKKESRNSVDGLAGWHMECICAWQPTAALWARPVPGEIQAARIWASVPYPSCLAPDPDGISPGPPAPVEDMALRAWHTLGRIQAAWMWPSVSHLALDPGWDLATTSRSPISDHLRLALRPQGGRN